MSTPDDFSWRDRGIALACLGAAALNRFAFTPGDAIEPQPLEMQVLVALALQDSVAADPPPYRAGTIGSASRFVWSRQSSRRSSVASNAQISSTVALWRRSNGSLTGKTPTMTLQASCQSRSPPSGSRQSLAGSAARGSTSADGRPIGLTSTTLWADSTVWTAVKRGRAPNSQRFTPGALGL